MLGFCVPRRTNRLRLGVKGIEMSSPPRKHIGLGLAIVLLGVSSSEIHANAPQSISADDELLVRVGKYVQQLEDQLAVVIGDETYQQDVWERGRHVETRAIRSEMLFMSLSRQDAWLSVRNVLFVDGRSIADSKGRLDRIMAAPGLDYLLQLRLLKAESARYDVGHVWRTTGDPTLIFRFLLPANQTHFTFGQPRRERVDGIEALKLTFAEHEHPTAIDFDGHDALSHGAVWVRPDDGTVVRTNLQVTTPGSVDVSVTVTFTSDARLAVWVPRRMDESYSDGRMTTRCAATYANFRRFETSGRLIQQ
jgi:hypothetical protein